MTLRTLLWPALLLVSLNSLAAPPKPLFVDHSTASVMDAATAQALWAANMPAKVWKLYPVKKWGYLSQVEGGFGVRLALKNLDGGFEKDIFGLHDHRIRMIAAQHTVGGHHQVVRQAIGDSQKIV